jgi:hypothetical protein
LAPSHDFDMHHAKTLRILMAFVLATCSPMWCQCMIRAVSAAPAPVALALPQTCDDDCGAPQLVPIVTVCCDESCDEPGAADDGRCNCECCAQELTASLNIGHSHDVAALALMHLCVVGLDAPVAINSELDVSRWIGRYRTGPPPLPSLTLVDQHSLLLI